jgi:diketogulonate reductase-like aldo/keto reductase
MHGKSPTVRLNNGVEIPMLGFGVMAMQDQLDPAIQAALAAGYRLFDTAAIYGNERDFGASIRRSGVPRAELFITTKLWMSDYGDRAQHGFDTSMKKLGIDHLDLYLLHWPVPATFEKTIQSYRVAVKMLEQGRTRAIGVSNFTPRLLDRLIAETGVTPALNQVELHPYFAQKELRAAHQRLGVVTQAWSPIGGSYVRNAKAGAAATPLESATVKDLAGKHGKTPAQIVLRWHLQHAIVTIPKSVKPERIAQNVDILDFALTAAEMSAIDALDTNVRAGLDPETVEARVLGGAIPDA